MEAGGRLAVAEQDHTDVALGTRELRVPIVLPAHNEQANVEQAITEASQTASRLFAEHEIIVVDDGSSEETARRVKRIATSDPRIGRREARVVEVGVHPFKEVLRMRRRLSRLDPRDL